MALTAVFASAALHDHPPPVAPTFTALALASSGADYYDGGPYRIADTVVIKGTPDVPVSRRVLLHDQLNGRVIRSAWSDATTGAYAFERLRMGKYYVVAFDHTLDKRAVVADHLTPEPMP